jgi:hypothetical protein
MSKASTATVDLGVFIAYFPSWLKFHEIHRLGAYTHPFEFMKEQYRNDLGASSSYSITDESSWTGRFEKLESLSASPIAFLTPAMQEGSALSGPFLPLEWTLAELHMVMGLGSIWTIGLPFMPTTVKTTDTETVQPHRLHAIPGSWKDEFQCNGPSSSKLDLNFVSSTIVDISVSAVHEHWGSLSSSLYCRPSHTVTHIGAKLGVKLITSNPGWTTHLPGKNGVVCSRWAQHDLNIPGRPQTLFLLTRTEEGQAEVSKKAIRQREAQVVEKAKEPDFGKPLEVQEEPAATRRH